MMDLPIMTLLRDEAKEQESGNVGDGAYAADVMRRAEAELNRLQAIVDKLPKCWRFNDDKTALVQTCPVVLGMDVWWAIGDIPWTGVVRATFCNYLLAFTEDGLKWSKESTLVHSDCFDSAAAAEFATQAEKGT